MADTIESTFLFADLAGFTALTEAMGDEEAADLAEKFSERVAELLPTHGAEQIKTIGDALMIRADDPTDAVRLALCITRDVAEDHGFLAVRVGAHTGPAVARSGDWFGATVNLAARVAGVASGREVVITETTWRLCGDAEGLRFSPAGHHTLKNVSDPVQLYIAERADESAAQELPVDPVCRMVLDPTRATETLVHDGVEYHFCSLECVRTFVEDPSRYASEGSE